MRFHRVQQQFESVHDAPIVELEDGAFHDNFRMLHARTGFVGARWMRGVYFDDPETRASRAAAA